MKLNANDRPRSEDVYLDGRKLDYVVEVDDEAGYADVYVMEGDPPRAVQDKGRPVIKRLTGSVEVRWRFCQECRAPLPDDQEARWSNVWFRRAFCSQACGEKNARRQGEQGKPAQGHAGPHCLASFAAFESFDRILRLVAAMPWGSVEPPPLVRIQYRITPRGSLVGDPMLVRRYNEYRFAVEDDWAAPSNDPCEAFAHALMRYHDKIANQPPFAPEPPDAGVIRTVACEELWVVRARDLLGHVTGVSRFDRDGEESCSLTTALGLMPGVLAEGKLVADAVEVCSSSTALMTVPPDGYVKVCDRCKRSMRPTALAWHSGLDMKEGWVCGACVPIPEVPAGLLVPVSSATPPLAQAACGHCGKVGEPAGTCMLCGAGLCPVCRARPTASRECPAQRLRLGPRANRPDLVGAAQASTVYRAEMARLEEAIKRSFPDRLPVGVPFDPVDLVVEILEEAASLIVVHREVGEVRAEARRHREAIESYERAAKRYGHAMRTRQFRVEIKTPTGTLDTCFGPGISYEFDLPNCGPHYIAVLRTDSKTHEGRDLGVWQKQLPPGCKLIMLPPGAEFTVVELVAVDLLDPNAVLCEGRRFPQEGPK